MFALAHISDLIQIPPHEFYKRSRHAVEDKINEKYANKVVQNVGLCFCMYDLVKVSDGLIGHGTGLVNVQVEFRMIVFRPFKGEIIVGYIQSSSRDGIRISTHFFNDIFVPPSMLFLNAEFDEREAAWVWQTQPDDGEPQSLYFDKGDTVRFRVEQEKWFDMATIPKPPRPQSEETSTLGPTGTAAPLDVAATAREIEEMVPYSLIASMNDSGLGNVLWW